MAKKKDPLEQLWPILGGSVKGVLRRICGEHIGSGLYRDVYVLKQNPHYVVKVERDMSKGDFVNVVEWRNYINNKEWKLVGPWLASCEGINKTGEILIQERLNWDRKRRKDYPKYIPVVFTDLKFKNFGWTLDGRFVCCDYAYLVPPSGKKEMMYAKWWGKLH